MPTITSPTVEFCAKVLLGVIAEVDPSANVKVEFGSTFSPAKKVSTTYASLETAKSPVNAKVLPLNVRLASPLKGVVPFPVAVTT